LIVSFPGFDWAQNIRCAHDRFRSEKSQQAHLSNAAKMQAIVISEARQPPSRRFMMCVSLIRQRNPNIYVREKE